MSVSTPELPGRGTAVATLLMLVAGCAPLLLDKVMPPLGIPAAILAIWLLLRWQGQSMAVVGIRRPDGGWWRAVAIGVAGVILILAFGQFIYPLLLNLFGLPSQDLSGYASIEGNNGMLAAFMTISWTTAGFGEELIFRGFLMAGLARCLGQSRVAWAAALVISSVTFGLVHLPTGWGAVLTTGLNGAILAGVYLVSRRSIWPAYIAHGLSDTVAVLVIYTGLYKDFPGLA